MNKQKNQIPDFEGAAERLLKNLPQEVAEMAKGFFKDSFHKEGFTDNSFIAWAKRKDTALHKILSNTHALRDSITIVSATMKRIEVEAGKGIPYAAIHNTGGTIVIRVTEKAKRYFWFMFKKTEDIKWKYMALTKKETLTIVIPQRQYIGESQQLLKNIDSLIISRIENLQFINK